MAKDSKVDQDARLLYVLLRYELDMDQAEFAAATRTAPAQVSQYDRGRRTVPDVVLERAATACEFPRSLIPTARRAIRSFRAMRRSWSRIERVFSELSFYELLKLGEEALEALTLRSSLSQVAQESAENLWTRLELRNIDQRLALVEELESFRSWPLCVLVAAKSIERAPSNPPEALQVAKLALRIAELCTGDEDLRRKAQGYCWFHVANALRFNDDLPGSNTALATARRLWVTGGSQPGGLFDEALVLGLEATIRKDQRRFPEALQRIEEALSLDGGRLRSKLLLTKAQILAALGETAAAAETLREALAHTDEERDPRTALGIFFQFLICLWLEGRAGEAASLLPRVQALGEKLNQEMDKVRLVWLRGRIAAGTGQVEEAEAAFEQARHAFASHHPPLAFNYALVSLDLGLLWLEQGHTARARVLAEEMRWIFADQGVEQGVLASLQIFCEAARREAATAELARRVIRFLHRAQHDPELRFGAEEGPASRESDTR